MNGPESNRLNALAADLVEVLLERGLTLAVAESSAGGMVSNLLTQAPGSSAVFIGGVVAYSDRLKRKIGVAAETLETTGAASEETAEAMAESIRHWSGADIGIAETGIAGPGGGTSSRPVGLFHVAVADEHRMLSERVMAEGDRWQNKIAAAEAVLRLLARHLEERE